jgi:hypothetical protein
VRVYYSFHIKSENAAVSFKVFVIRASSVGTQLKIEMNLLYKLLKTIISRTRLDVGYGNKEHIEN